MHKTEDELFRILSRTDAAAMRDIYRAWCSDDTDYTPWQDILLANHWTLNEWANERNTTGWNQAF